MSDRRKRGLRWLAVVLVPVLVGAWWLARAFEGERSLVEVVRGDLSLGVEVTGALQAVESVFLGPPQGTRAWQFRITHMAPEGREVEAGTPVLVFDASELEQRLLELQGEMATAEKEIESAEKDAEVERRDNRLRLNEAEGKLRKARLKVERPEELQEEQELAVARLDLQVAEMTVEHLSHRAELSARVTEARLAGLRDQRDHALQRVREVGDAVKEMTRLAPRRGTVIYVADWTGGKNKIGDLVWKGAKVIELPDLSAMRGEGQVEEQDAGQLAEGQAVTLRLDAHPDVEFTGRIASIWRTVQAQSWNNPLKVARLDIALNATDARRMRPGMRFRGWVETEQVTDALLLPLDVVEATPEGPVVYRKGVLGVEPIRVELGRRSGSQVEVLGGLQEGDLVERIAIHEGSEGA